MSPRSPTGGGRLPSLPLSQGGTAWIVAADAGVYEELRAALAGEELAGVPVQVVRSSEFSNPGRESDFYFRPYQPTVPGLVHVLTFVNGDRFTLVEQNPSSGAVYRGGTLLWPNAPLEWVNVTNESEPIKPGCDAALYFRDEGFRRVTTLPNVVLVARPFIARPADVTRHEFIEEDWVNIAHRALSEDGPAAGQPS